MPVGKRLKKLSDARRFLAGLINRTERGEVDPALSSKLGYLTNILIRAIEGSEVERRIDRLEQRRIRR